MTLLISIFDGILQVAKEVFLAISPIVVIFVLLQVFAFHLKPKRFWRIMKGFLLTFLGLVLFLQGVNIAYLPIGQHLGEAFATLNQPFLLIPLGFSMGFLVALAEPAIHVMVTQVEEMTAGSVKGRRMLRVVSIGVGSAVALAMWRLLAGFSLYYILIPGYALVFLLGRKVDKIFLMLAFDNGGVATGPMCSTFLLSMFVSLASNLEGRDPMLDGLGMVALIALAPIVTTLLLGYIYKKQEENRLKNKAS